MSNGKTPLKPQLWTERSVEETLAVYADWADSYDRDVTGRGYHTPGRIAAALAPLLPAPDAPILDYGCGTGVSGAALKARGLTRLDGTDISPEMVKVAEGKSLYGRLWVGEPGETPATPGTYDAIVAAGVVSLGAAPPETLNLLLESLAKGGLLALSFNDPTLESGSYDAVLQARLDDGTAEILFRQHGPHLDDMQMGSDVIVLRRL